MQLRKAITLQRRISTPLASLSPNGHGAHRAPYYFEPMIPPDDISARLPAPRDDEPHELRGDIADELADHLACSMGRERLRDDQQRGRSEEELFGEVIDRFGDPREVARRLWWDAMKEKIMAQRLMMGVTLVAAAAAIVAVVLLTRLIATNREDQQQMLAAQREWMQAMLAEMRKPREKDAEQSGEWNSLLVKMVDENDRPVKGDVKCQGTPLGNQHLIAESLQTDTDGVADFGRFPPGFYQISACVKATNENTQRTVLLGPGRPMEVTIRCPTNDGPPIPATFQITTPRDISNDRLYFVAQLVRLGRNVDGSFWQYVGKPQRIAVLLDAKGSVLGELPTDIVDGSAHRRPLTGGGMISRNVGQFINELPSTVPLSPAQNIIPSSYSVALAAYGTDVVPDEAKERKTLRLVAVAPTFEGTVLGDGVVAHDSWSNDESFWENVRQGFRRLQTSEFDSGARNAKVPEDDSAPGTAAPRG
jgi:hypothetical protein